MLGVVVAKRAHRVRLCAVIFTMLVAVGLVSSAQAAVVSIPVGSWQANGRVEQIVIVGNTAYLAGQFTSMRPYGDAAGTGEVTRNRVAAVNVATGALLPWNPNANNTVQTIAVSGSTVYLGGLFTTVGGKNSSHLAAVDATSGAVVSAWKGSTNAEVMSIALGNGVLYAGGAFTTAQGGTARAHLAGFDLTAGNLTSWAPAADAQVNAVGVSPDGSRVLVGGTFTHIGTSVQHYLAALDPSTGAALPWASHPTSALSTMFVDSTGVYTGATGAGGTVNAYATATGQQRWQAGVDGNVQALGALDGLLYVGGHFANYCGAVPGTNHCRVNTPRAHLMALTEAAGAIDPWHASANGTLGVFSIAGGSGVITIGGDFTKAGGVAQQGFAEFSTITDPTLTDTANGQPTTAGSVTVTASGSTDSGPGLVGYRYQTSTNGGTTWSASHNNKNTAVVNTVGTTLVRFQAYDSYANASNWVTDSVTIQPSGGGGGGGGTAVVTFKASGTGTAGTSGNATVKGTYTCSGASPISISGTVTQASTGASASFTTTVACPGNTTSTKWSTVAKAGTAKFVNGAASEHVTWSATDLSNNQPLGTTQTVALTLD